MSIDKQTLFPEVVEIAKGAIDPDLRQEVTDGIEDVWSQYEALVEHGREIGHLVLPYTVLRHTVDLSTAIRKIATTAEVPTAARIAITSYEPGGMTNFHTDNRNHAVIIYPDGEGWLDVSPHARSEAQAERSPLAIEANAGDIIFANTTRYHRGRNSEAGPRKSMAFLFD